FQGAAPLPPSMQKRAAADGHIATLNSFLVYIQISLVMLAAQSLRPLSGPEGIMVMSSTTKKRKQTGQPTKLGSAIRHRRKALGKTLENVADETELTTGFISQVERGISSPSLSSLMSIAASLQTSVEQLVSVPEKYSEYVQKDRRQSYTLGTEGRFYEKLGPGFPGALIHSQIIHRPAGHESEKMCHQGEVFCYLLAGEVEYHLNGEVFIMKPGDVIHHHTSKPHFSRVLGKAGSVELWVSTSPMSNVDDGDN
ncbi:MAG: cupin domain-containing protein, partial [Albidovulum sp.]